MIRKLLDILAEYELVKGERESKAGPGWGLWKVWFIRRRSQGRSVV